MARALITICPQAEPRRYGPRCPCGNKAAKLCDYPVAPVAWSKHIGVCCAPLCDNCTEQGGGKDYCAEHVPDERWDERTEHVWDAIYPR